MPKLILIKHAKPTVTPGQPPESWPLSEEGRQRCTLLAERIKEQTPQIILSSDEVKASETATLLAAALSLPVEIDPNLKEHDRSDVPQMQTREFISYMALLFKKPDELVLGNETGNEALERFTHGVEAAQKKHADKDIAIVSHGTVIALYAAQITGEDPFGLWRRMGLPSFVVLENNRLLSRLDQLP